MGRIVGIIFGLFVLLLVLGKCAEPDDVYDPVAEKAKFDAEALATGFDSPKQPPTSEGEAIPVPSDPGATYRLLKSSKMANGHVEAITRRDGSSGTSFARREINCEDMMFRYIGEGDTREEAERDGPNPGKMADLIPGSISTESAEFICSKTR